ncbi:MAG: helix-turn-helix domain-containing protein, partial [Verrucomicrobiota bacterium]
MRQIARRLNTSRPTVLLWRERFAEPGVAGLEHEPPRRASRQRLNEAVIKQIVDTTLQTTPPAATHWSTRTLGGHLGISHMTVARVWDRCGLQPHRERTFKLSRDKQFVEKLTDIVGLYLNPPDK